MLHTITTKHKGFLNINNVMFYELPDGVTRESWDYLERGDSVTILVKVEGQDSFVVLKQFRVGDYIRNGSLESYSNPAGMIDKGETPFVAALRELDEEIGCSEPVSLTYLGKGFPSSGGCSEVSHMFFAVVPKPLTVFKPKDKSEGITVTTITKQYYESSLMNGRFTSLQMQTTYLLASSKNLI